MIRVSLIIQSEALLLFCGRATERDREIAERQRDSGETETER